MPEDHPSYQQLHHSAETVRQIASEVNSRITQSERDARMVELDARLGGKEVLGCVVCHPYDVVCSCAAVSAYPVFSAHC